MRADRLRASFESVSRTLPLSPWAGPAVLTPVDVSALIGSWGAVLTRAEAMSVPAVAAARHRIVGTIARMPLQAERDGAPLDEQPTWIYAADTQQSPGERMRGTADDLLFHGEALWMAYRGASGDLLRVAHVPRDRWAAGADGRWLIDDEELPADAGIYFTGPHSGILSFGAATIRGASRTLAAAVDVAEHPMRLELHDTGDYPMTHDEQRDLVSGARAAMADSGGVIYSSPGVEARLHPVDVGAMLVDGRESFAVDIARLVGIPGAMIDAHSRGATMTYSTTADVLAAFLHLGLTLYMQPITDRLSQDDICPRGMEVRFNLDSVLGAAALTQPQKPATEQETA